jgi:uroporphyrin-III C-methyltransferase/precorrin-2 dehydrogenase/sirohydrochlorin ferrochelatase
MMSHFPIFVDLHGRPPLVIGDADVLSAKVRLLQKVAPLVEVIPTAAATWHRAFDEDAWVQVKPAVTLGATGLAAGDHARLDRAIKGRPLVILDTGDAANNQRLAAMARDHGVPVNVPDAPDLCSFYLASIVDRAPLIIAISTSGTAPVLGQVIRARLESMLASHYGNLAGFLHGLRGRLAGQTPARRRTVQRQIVTGPASAAFLAGDTAGATKIVDRLLNNAAETAAAGTISLVGYGRAVLCRGRCAGRRGNHLKDLSQAPS